MTDHYSCYHQRVTLTTDQDLVGYTYNMVVETWCEVGGVGMGGRVRVGGRGGREGEGGRVRGRLGGRRVRRRVGGRVRR